MGNRRAGLALVLLLAAWTGQAGAFPCFIGPPPKTFRETAADANLIVYGSVAPLAKGKPADATDCHLAGVIKTHPIAAGKKVLKLSRQMDGIDRNNPPAFLFFCDVHKGRIDPFRGVPASPVIVDYLRGMLALKAANTVARLSYCFDYLEHADAEIANDALLEFQKAPDQDLKRAAPLLSAARLRSWLKNEKATPYRLALYAFLLGHCGKSSDKPLLRGVLDRLSKKEQWGGFDQVLVGYTILAPRDGWSRVRGILDKPGNGFMLRYSALRACRFFFTTRPEVIGKKAVLDALRPLLDQGDIADIAIEDLRRWKRWDLTTRILPLYGKTPAPVPVIRRAILRYALRCPLPEAATFVAERRKADPEMVADQEKLLELEKDLR